MAKNKIFDLQLYDTVLIGGDRYVVTAIRNTEFDVKSQNKRPNVMKTFLKQQYITGKPMAITKKNFAPVTAYVDESLKRKEPPRKGKAAVINQEFDDAAEDMIKAMREGRKSELEQGKAVVLEPEVSEEKKSGRVEDIPLADVPEDIFGFFTQVTAKDDSELVAYRQATRDQIESGQPVNVNMVNRYNRIVRHYYG